MKLGRVFLIAMAATLFVPLIGVESAGAQTIAYSPFIGADGTQLTLNGGPYQFTGLNIFNAAVNGSAEETCNVQLGTDGTAPLSQQLSNIDSGTGGNAKVFRFWMFQNLAIVGGSIDWSFLDNVFATAQADGFKVIPVLDDSDPSCEYSNQRKTDTWYQTGYTQVDPGNIMSYQDWVQEVVTRYASNPTIAMWMMMNEATDPTSSGTCPSNAASILESFATTIGGMIHSIDPNHLVALGTEGGKGDCGSGSGSDYATVNSSPGIDVCEVHEYVGDGTAFDPVFKKDVAACAALNKPTIVGEVGIKLTGDMTLSKRADDFDKKMSAQFSGGVSGFLPWNWVDPNEPDQDAYSITDGDPTLPILGEYAPPVTTVLVPSANSDVNGTAVTLDASATNESGISSVDFVLTGGSLTDDVIATASLTEYGWIAQWNSTSVPDGTYNLQSVAYDANQLAGWSPAVPITVNN